MKSKITLALAALIAVSSVKVRADERGWATAGKILTGVSAVLILDKVLTPRQTVVVQQPVVYSPPVVVQQPQVIVQPQPVVQSVVYIQPTPVVQCSTPTVIIYPGCPTPVYTYHSYRHNYGHSHRHR